MRALQQVAAISKSWLWPQAIVSIKALPSHSIAFHFTLFLVILCFLSLSLNLFYFILFFKRSVCLICLSVFVSQYCTLFSISRTNTWDAEKHCWLVKVYTKKCEAGHIILADSQWEAHTSTYVLIYWSDIGIALSAVSLGKAPHCHWCAYLLLTHQLILLWDTHIAH